MVFIATSYNARAWFHFVVYLVLQLYEMDVILLFDQYLLAKQQNDIHSVWLHYGIHDKMKTVSRMVRCSYKQYNEYLYFTGYVLNCRLYIRLDGAMDKALDLRIRGREIESRYGQEFFIL